LRRLRRGARNPGRADVPRVSRAARGGRNARRHNDRVARGVPRHGSRGDDRLSEEKLVTALGEAYRPMTDEDIRAVFGAGGGSLGPVGVTIDILADDTLREGQFVAGANKDGWHLRGVEA